MTDTTASEADFSVQGYLRIKQLTSMSFEERMWWFTHVLGRLRKVGHEHGETSRAARRLAMSQSMDTLEPQSIQVQTDVKLSWCRTHGQSAAIATTIEKEFLPMFTPDKMMDARTVRKGLKIGDGFVANDEARVVSWTEALVVDSDRYRRDVPIDELRKKSREVVLNFDMPPECTEAIPLRRRLDLPYKRILVDQLYVEFQCHLPMFLLCLRAMSEEGIWPTCGLTRLIMACLLPPRLPLSALSSFDVATIAEAESMEQRQETIKKATEIKRCFNDQGRRVDKTTKPQVLQYLDQFSWGAVRILEFLGNHHADVQGE